MEDYTDRERIEIGIIDIEGKNTQLKDFVRLTLEEQRFLYVKTCNWLKSIEEKIKKHDELVHKQNEAEKFKDYQRRTNLGQLTPEELAEKDRKRKEKAEKYYSGHKKR